LWADIADERHGAGLIPQMDAFEPIEEVAHRLWLLGGSPADSAMAVLETAVDDVVHRYEVEGPARLAPHAVRLRHRLETLLSARPSIVQRERLLTLAGRTSGLLAYMAVNLGRFHQADAYATEAFALAREAGDGSLMAWVRGTQSFACYYRRDYPEAVALARDGLTYAGNGPQAVRLRVNGEARALAFLRGRRREAEHAVAEAYKLVEQLAAPAGISPCISLGIYSGGRVVANAITVFQTLGQPRRVLELVDEIEATVHTSDSAWSRSLVHLDQAATFLQRPYADVEQAMHVALRAIAASVESPITSVMQRGKAIANATEQFLHLPAVQEYHEQIRVLTASGRSRRS
jgi:hypothetical protein